MNSLFITDGAYLSMCFCSSAPPGPGSTMVAPSFCRSATARSAAAMLSSSASLKSERSMYSRSTPMRTPSSRASPAKLAYGDAGIRPTLNTVSSSFGS